MALLPWLLWQALKWVGACGVLPLPVEANRQQPHRRPVLSILHLHSVPMSVLSRGRGVNTSTPTTSLTIS